MWSVTHPVDCRVSPDVHLDLMPTLVRTLGLCHQRLKGCPFASSIAPVPDIHLSGNRRADCSADADAATAAAAHDCTQVRTAITH